MASSSGAVRVGTLGELKEKRCAVVSLDRPVVVFYQDGRVFALDNRCPHMGFPLHRGNVEDGILTCHWHHARFDLTSGCTFDLWADDVACYPVELRDGEVWVKPRPPSDVAAHARRKLIEGMQQGIRLVVAKSAITLLDVGEDARNIVRQGALFGTRFRDDWANGLTIHTAMANLLPYLNQQEQFLPLWHGLVWVTRNVSGESPHWERLPLATDDVPFETLKRWLQHWTLVRHRDAAERCVLTAIANGASQARVAELLFSAATARIYANEGHLLDFTNKACELLDIIGWEDAAQVLPTLMNQLVSSQGGEESSTWRRPLDLVALIQNATEQTPAWFKQGDGKTWSSETDLAEHILSDEPTPMLAAIGDAIRQGAKPAQLSRALAYAAAMRIARFGTSNEFGDWITALHTFSYCNAVHQLFKRVSGDHETPAAQAASRSPELVRGLFHGALKVYLDRFLNMPPAPLPTRLDDEPAEPQELLGKFLDTLNRQAQVNEAARIVARYLSLGHDVERLIPTLIYAVVREDADFHTYQVIEAAVRQYKEWRGTKQGNHILIAAARYIAAHSPTQREMLQTADIAQRLHRGEPLYEEA